MLVGPFRLIGIGVDKFYSPSTNWAQGGPLIDECDVWLSDDEGSCVATCRHPMTDKKAYLGLFDTQEAAHKAWVDRKLSIALELKCEMDVIDERIYDGVVSIINSMR